MEYCKIEWLKGSPEKPVEKVEAKVPLEEVKRNEPTNSAQPVKVTLYFESLCPDCRQFILNQWYPAYKALAESGILELELVPFGNARVYDYNLLKIKTCLRFPPFVFFLK